MEITTMLEGFVNVSAMLKPGVYALIYGGAVVYIGQSRRPLDRIYAHRSLNARKKSPGWLPIKGIMFDEAHVIPCRVEDLDTVERALIDLYKPKFNIKLKAPGHSTAEFNLTITTGVCVAINAKAPQRSGFIRRI
jgi:hypothetical protein